MLQEARKNGERRRQPTTAVFYSISNCQEGLRGISFGNFLIKQVVEDLAQGAAEPQDVRHAVAGAELRALARPRCWPTISDGHRHRRPTAQALKALRDPGWIERADDEAAARPR